jgi:hypothetical protein
MFLAVTIAEGIGIVTMTTGTTDGIGVAITMIKPTELMATNRQ